jgi:hypothetical protein
MIISEGMVWVVAGSAVAVMIAAGLVIGARRSARMGAMYQVHRQFRDVKIIACSDRVEFRGLDRIWDGQWRGLGVLVLTDDCLYFRLSERDMDLSVPVSRIEGVEEVGEGDQGALRRRQIRVAYRAFDDQLRTATWNVRNARQWREQILAAIDGKK